ncbi:MAG: hypothetical protein ABSB71_07945 [Candidatus Bathyarchaeia archaeon]|jgi:hypothetical protein
MTERRSNDQNPSGIWQGIWANLYNQFFEQMTFGNYSAAWDTALSIQTVIPPDCQEDTKEEYDKVSQVFAKPISSFHYASALQQKHRQINIETPKVLRDLIRAVTKSLYDKGWINKDFTAKPKETRPEGKL